MTLSSALPVPLKKPPENVRSELRFSTFGKLLSSKKVSLVQIASVPWPACSTMKSLLRKPELRT